MTQIVAYLSIDICENQRDQREKELMLVNYPLF
jgi:hypothetical protein